jgi:hypothetical protein
MKEKILQKIYETCPELKKAIKYENLAGSVHKLYPEPQLNHLLRTMENKLDDVWTWTPDGDPVTNLQFLLSHYFLTDTVEQNLQNEELANFIGEIIL